MSIEEGEESGKDYVYVPALRGLATPYRQYYDMRTPYNGQLLQRPFTPNHRFFLNFGYATAFDKWRFDFTTQGYGHRPVPVMGYSPDNPQIRTTSVKPYTTLNAQVTRAFKLWDVYLGEKT